MATNTGDILLFGIIGSIAAYATNLGGFKTWVDQYIVQPPPPEPPVPPVGEPLPEPEPDPKPKPEPKPPVGQPFKCVSYPRCNTVSGTDARKKCCCNNKCALLGRTMKSVNLFTGLCLCNPKPKPTPTPTNCTGPCPLGTRPGVVNGKCGCAKCTNTCGSCFDRVSNCGCKLNTNKLTHVDTYCKSTCGGYSCWTNYPCPNRGARAQKCVKGTCAQARAAWLAAYSCKSSLARKAYPSHGRFYPQESLDDGLMQVPTIA